MATRAQGRVGTLSAGASESLGEVLERSVAALVHWSAAESGHDQNPREAAKLSPMDGWVIRRLLAAGPMRMSELSDWRGVDRSTITVQVKRLQARGLVHRQADPRDGRVVVVEATAAARRVHEEYAAAGEMQFDSLIGSWSVRDRNELGRLLVKLVETIEHVRE